MFWHHVLSNMDEECPSVTNDRRKNGLRSRDDGWYPLSSAPHRGAAARLWFVHHTISAGLSPCEELWGGAGLFVSLSLSLCLLTWLYLSVGPSVRLSVRHSADCGGAEKRDSQENKHQSFLPPLLQCPLEHLSAEQIMSCANKADPLPPPPPPPLHSPSPSLCCQANTCHHNTYHLHKTSTVLQTNITQDSVFQHS